MPLPPGTRIGVYEITGQLGVGGMGEVYRAHDTKLGRDVAIKVVLESLVENADRAARFQREAWSLAALNHPNIATLHGMEEVDGQHFLVMELVEGDDLSVRTAHGAIPIDEALPIARQIAEALEAAHERGIIHRDLKPANIKVKADGTVKVLDFGLAKALGPDETSAAADAANSPTLTARATQMGMILGTAAYMAPEQARGKVVDRRADIWAFGVVLFEMLTGTRAFEGEDVSLTLSAVLQREPDWAALPPAVPRSLDVYLRRCLKKDPRQRVQAIGDMRLALEGAFETMAGASSEPVAPPQLQIWQRPAGLALITVGTALVASLAVWSVMRPDTVAAPALVRFTMLPPDTAPLDLPGNSPDLAISPDGTRVIYQSATPGVGFQLQLRPIDMLVGAPIRGTEGAAGPFVSPDGEWVGFHDNLTGRVLQKAPIFGGPALTLTKSPLSIVGASWGADDQIIFGTGGGGLFRISGGGGDPEVLTTPDSEQAERAHMWPFIIPGRNAVLFVISAGEPLADGQLAVLDLETRRVARLGLAGVSPRYAATGHLVFAAGDGSVRAVPFDAASLAVMGSPVPLVEGINVKGTGAANFSISDNGRLAYTVGDGARATNLVLVARDGMRSLLAGLTGVASFPRFSPDGSRVAYAVSADRVSSSDADLWVLEMVRGAQTRVTFDGNNRFYPVWTPDGARLAHADGSAATNRLVWTAADGSGTTATLMELGDRRFPTSWSPDGRFLAYYVGPQGTPTTSRDLWMLEVDGDTRTPAPFVETPFMERGAIFSPDGRWVAYVSDKSGQNDVFARPFPGPGPEFTVSVGGGQEPVWAPSGNELYYRHGGELLVVSVKRTASSLTVGMPRLVFADPYLRDLGGAQGGMANYDIAPGGDRFVMVEMPQASDTAEITVVLNWFEELKTRVPVR